MGKIKEVYECPICKSKATYKVSAGTLLFMIESILSILVITAIVGIPLILLSPLAYVIEKMIGKYQYMCRSCKHGFVIDAKKEARG